MSAEFSPSTYINEQLGKLSGIEGKVLVTVSGGVDSTVSAELLRRAGTKIDLLHIDTAFQRLGEVDEVKSLLQAAGLSPEVQDRRNEFLSAVHGIADAQAKREAFRQAYFKVLMGVMEERGITQVVQGTQFYMGSGRVGHNAPTATFQEKRYVCVEPVKGLSKSEIRSLAAILDLPEKIVQRRPFPGPGLLIRFGGAVSEAKLDTIRQATAAVDQFVAESESAFNGCDQIFPYLTDGGEINSIDEDGERSGGHAIFIRAVRAGNPKEGVLFDPFFPDPSIQREMVDVVMQLNGIARVLWDVTPKYAATVGLPSAGIEYI